MRTVWARSWGQRWKATAPAIASGESILMSKRIYGILNRNLGPYDIMRAYIFIIDTLTSIVCDSKLLIRR